MAKHIRGIRYKDVTMKADVDYEISIVGYEGRNPTPDFFPWNPHSGEKKANCQLVVYKHPVGSAPQGGSHVDRLIIPRNAKFSMETEL